MIQIYLKITGINTVKIQFVLSLNNENMITKTNNSTLKNKTKKHMMPFLKKVSPKPYKKTRKKFNKSRMINKLMNQKK